MALKGGEGECEGAPVQGDELARGGDDEGGHGGDGAGAEQGCSAAQQELLALARQLESEGKMMLKMETDDDIAV